LKWLIRNISGGLTQVTQFLLSLGPIGLFTISLLDSAMIPLVGGPDAVMILLSTARPGWMPLYALSAMTGSVAGCIVLYYISRKAGRRALDRFSPAKQARVKELIDRYDVLSVLVASVLPPPFPFKLFVVTAGVFRLSLLRFAIAIGFGRAFRYFLEGFLVVRYGGHATEILKQYYPAIGIGMAVLIIGGFLVRGFIRRRHSAETVGTES
jgi:membrane protein YqaA with SNARE-associated domain